MLSKNKIKLIKSLDLKKNRLATGLFVAEGKKLVSDLLGSEIRLSQIYCTESAAAEIKILQPHLSIEITEKDDLSKISFLKTTPEVVAVFEIPQSEIVWDEMERELTIVLDAIQDPGNLGTIVRIADWFGIRNIVCSEDCADLYNPKVIQSSMGAVARVKVHYLSLSEFLKGANQKKIPLYGTFLKGENLYECELTPNGLIVMGNEGKGISENTADFISRRINIPSFPAGDITSESLNVAMATSIICSEFRRRVICKD